MDEKRTPNHKARNSYDEYRNAFLSDPTNLAIYREEAQKKELWLQLQEARHAAGLTQTELAERLGVSQAQVARLEKRGYDGYSVKSLHRYVTALGVGFEVRIIISLPPQKPRRRRKLAVQP